MASLIPVIDMSRSLDEIGAAIDDTCRRTGFFQVEKHGVNPATIDDMWDAAADFFREPLAVKEAVTIVEGDAYGYAGFGAERLAASLGEQTPPDLKETFSIGPFDPPPAIATDSEARFVYSPNRFPTEPATLAAVSRRYYDAMADLAARIMVAMAVGLGLPASHFDTAIDRHTSSLRLLHYPDLGGRPAQPGQLRAGAHSDYGTLTLLRQDDAPGGLEVRAIDGNWHPVPARPDAFVVNVGDALQRWTNDRWRSTLHRVVVPPLGDRSDATRQSIAFFHNANWDATLACLPTCCDAEHPARYEPVTAGRHLMEKFYSTQPSVTDQ